MPLSLLEQPPIPGYEPVRPLGINLGAVYLARHSSSGALVVLKVFHRNDAAHLRALHEPLIRLNHPNIIRVFGFGEFEEYSYFALEYVEGSLADRLVQGPLPEVETVRIVRALASALHYARDQDMILLNLTPKSILLTEENVPRVCDFRTNVAAGESPPIPGPSAFMAPEELSGTTNPATDVYRLGAAMYAMLTGQPPFERPGDLKAMLYQIAGKRPNLTRQVNPKVGRDLELVCMKCLEKQPEARYASLPDLARVLEPFGEGWE